MLESADIVLAPIRDEDVSLLFEWINDRALVLLSSPYRPVHERSHHAWFKSIRNDSSKVVFAIREKRTGMLIGACQLTGIHPVHRHAQLQIRIGEAVHRGRGFGVQAVRLLLQHGFSDLNLERVFLHVFADNGAAIRAYEKAGFRHEGLLRSAAFVDGRFLDIIVMAILRADQHGIGN
jgi:RimJ/RimL family protein N-acetyltransferase